MKYMLMLLLSPYSHGAILNTDFPVKPVFSGLSFEMDIKPVFKTSCTKCHNGTNQLPNITDYKVAYGLRAEIRKRVVESRTMPLYGNLSETDRTKVKNWLDSGANK